MSEHTDPSLFTIDFSVPPDPVKHPGRTWWMNKTVSVLAMTVERAIELMRKNYPQGEIHAIQRRSRGEVIVDTE